MNLVIFQFNRIVLSHMVCVTVRKLYHVLHTDANLSVTVEGPVKSHNVGRITLMQHLQLSDDLVPDSWLDLQVDQLRDNRGEMPDRNYSFIQR